MAHTTHRPRRPISPKLLWLLKAGGFRYSHSRDAYVLRGIGNDVGPVFKVRTAPLPTSSESQTSAEQTTSTGQAPSDDPRSTELVQ